MRCVIDLAVIIYCLNIRVSSRLSTIVAASIIAIVCTAIEVSYEFRYENWAVIERAYECKVHNLMIKSQNQTLTNVYGKHSSGKNNKSVIGLHILGQICYFVPKRINETFGNLEGLLIAHCGLKKVSSSDMQQFPKLQVLFMPNNDLEVLERDLFKHNQYLKAIVMNNNKIKHVGHEILTPLKYLTKIYFYKNHCIDTVAVNPNQMEELIIELIDHCPPVAKVIPKVKSETQLKFEEIDARISNLEERMIEKFDVLTQQFARFEELLLLQMHRPQTMVFQYDKLDPSSTEETSSDALTG